MKEAEIVIDRAGGVLNDACGVDENDDEMQSDVKSQNRFRVLFADVSSIPVLQQSIRKLVHLN